MSEKSEKSVKANVEAIEKNSDNESVDSSVSRKIKFDTSQDIKKRFKSVDIEVEALYGKSQTVKQSQSKIRSQNSSKQPNLKQSQNYLNKKLKDLDWYELEARISRIVAEQLADTQEWRYSQEGISETLKLDVIRITEEVGKLNDAVFYRNKSPDKNSNNQRIKRNIFHEVLEEVTKLKANFVTHSTQNVENNDRMSRQINQFGFDQNEMQLTVKKYQNLLDEQVIKFREFREGEAQMREQAQKYTYDTIEAMTHTVKQSGHKMTEHAQRLHQVDLKLFEALNKVAIVDKRIEQLNSRTDEIAKWNQQMQVSKVDQKFYEDVSQQQLKVMNELNSNFDTARSQIKWMERFIEKYVPIRIHLQITDTLKQVLPRQQLSKLESFEMMNVKKLNEDLLSDEPDKELKDICKGLLNELGVLLEKYKKIAKSKGIPYETRGLTENSNDSVSLQSGSQEKSVFSKFRSQVVKTSPDINIQQIDSEEDQEQEQDNLVGVEIVGTTGDDQMQGPKFEREDVSDLDEDEEKQRLREKLNKKHLLEWVTEADFTKEISLVKLSDHPFKLDEAEEADLMNFHRILKVMKIMMYKIGLVYKRQEIYRSELKDEISVTYTNAKTQIISQANSFSGVVSQLQADLSEFKSEHYSVADNFAKEQQVVSNLQKKHVNSVEELQKQIKGLALIQSCQTEFISMQNTIDQSLFQMLGSFNTDYKTPPPIQNQSQQINFVYRNQEFSDNKLFEMRALVIKKMIQVMHQQEHIFTDYLPTKIFRDLLQFYNKIEQEIQISKEVLIEEAESPKTEKVPGSLFSSEEFQSMRKTGFYRTNQKLNKDPSSERVSKPGWGQRQNLKKNGSPKKQTLIMIEGGSRLKLQSNNLSSIAVQRKQIQTRLISENSTSPVLDHRNLSKEIGIGTSFDMSQTIRSDVRTVLSQKKGTPTIKQTGQVTLPDDKKYLHEHASISSIITDYMPQPPRDKNNQLLVNPSNLYFSSVSKEIPFKRQSVPATDKRKSLVRDNSNPNVIKRNINFKNLNQSIQISIMTDENTEKSQDDLHNLSQEQLLPEIRKSKLI